MSNQPHYDFGLRVLKSVKIFPANVTTDKIEEGMVQKTSEENADKISTAENLPKQEIFMQSVCKTMFPELVPTRW